MRRLGPTKLLDYKSFYTSTYLGSKALKGSTSLAAPYTLSFTAPTLPNTIWFEEVVTTNDAQNGLTLTIQNA